MSPEQAVLCVGPLCIDELEFEADGTREAYPGGNAVITGATLARMGVRTVVAGSVGADQGGSWIKRTLASHGVSTSALFAETNCATRVGRNVVRRDGSWYREASSSDPCPYLTDTHQVQLDQFAHLHVGALNALARVAFSPLVTLIQSCRAAGMTVSIGLAGHEFERSVVHQLTTESDVLLCNRAELTHLVGIPHSELADVPDALAQSRFSRCVVTLGAFGAAVKWERLYHAVDAGGADVDFTSPFSMAPARPRRISQPPTPVVSTVGAGDVFAGVFLAAVLSNWGIHDCLRAAARAASLSVCYRRWDAWLRPDSSLRSLTGRETG